MATSNSINGSDNLISVVEMLSVLPFNCHICAAHPPIGSLRHDQLKLRFLTIKQEEPGRGARCRLCFSHRRCSCVPVCFLSES